MQGIEIVYGHISGESCSGARHASKLIWGLDSLSAFDGPCNGPADQRFLGHSAVEGLKIQNSNETY